MATQSRPRVDLLMLFTNLWMFSLLLSTFTWQNCEANRMTQRKLERAVDVTKDTKVSLSRTVRTDDGAAKDSVMMGVSVLRNDDDADLLNQNSSNSSQQVTMCVYTVVTQTGKQDGAGTDSDISLRVSNRNGDEIYFRKLANGHRTFEKGHTDTFVLQDRPCVPEICRMVLYTDDWGLFSEWFVVSLEISVMPMMQDGAAAGTQLQEKRWELNEWLPEEDDEEELYTIRDDCNHG